MVLKRHRRIKWIEKGHMTWNDENTPACKARGAPKRRKITSNENKDRASSI